MMRYSHLNKKKMKVNYHRSQAAHRYLHTVALHLNSPDTPISYWIHTENLTCRGSQVPDNGHNFKRWRKGKVPQLHLNMNVYHNAPHSIQQMDICFIYSNKIVYREWIRLIQWSTFFNYSSNHSDTVSFAWSSTELLTTTYKLIRANVQRHRNQFSTNPRNYSFTSK